MKTDDSEDIIKNPPFKPTYIINIEFEYAGESKPIPVEDPWNDYED